MTSTGAGSSSGKQLFLQFHGRVLEHLGVQMYQSPVNALAELIANAWDADASWVKITLPAKLEVGATIVIQDNGNGMTFEHCQDFYLNVGRNRRGISAEAKTTLVSNARRMPTVCLG